MRILISVLIGVELILSGCSGKQQTMEASQALPVASPTAQPEIAPPAPEIMKEKAPKKKGVPKKLTTK